MRITSLFALPKMSYTVVTNSKGIKSNMVVKFDHLDQEDYLYDLCDFIEDFLGCDVEILQNQSILLKGLHSLESIALSVKNFELCAN